MQYRAIQGLESRMPGSWQLAKWSPIELLKLRRDGAVKFVQGEELAVAQGSEYPVLNHLNTDLCYGLVEWLKRSTRRPLRFENRPMVGRVLRSCLSEKSSNGCGLGVRVGVESTDW